MRLVLLGVVAGCSYTAPPIEPPVEEVPLVCDLSAELSRGAGLDDGQTVAADEGSDDPFVLKNGGRAAYWEAWLTIRSPSPEVMIEAGISVDTFGVVSRGAPLFLALQDWDEQCSGEIDVRLTPALEISICDLDGLAATLTVSTAPLDQPEDAVKSEIEGVITLEEGLRDAYGCP